MKRITKFLTVSALVTASCLMIAAAKSDSVMTRLTDGTYVVNTTSLGRNVKGFAGPTPLKVYIKNDRVVKVEALPNRETPHIFSKVESSLLNRWNGKKAKKAEQMKPDAVSGATYSSSAVKENVRLALNYYNTHK